MAERRFTGQPAAPGLAIGRLVRLDRGRASSKRQKGTPAEERAALDRAIAKATADLEALAAVASGDGADILAFQIEMLGDPALIEDVLPAIDSGDDAASAWQAGLDGQITGYRSSGDDYFEARASDLDDLKDRVRRILEGAERSIPDLPSGALVLTDDLPPSAFLGLPSETIGGIALTGGSRSSHVAILARGRGLPMVVGLGDDVKAAAKDVDEAILDADAGHLFLTPDDETREHYRQQLDAAKATVERAASLRHRPAVTADGLRVEVMINVDDPDAVDDETLEAADGVGLLRSEFLLIGKENLPDEEAHFQHYAGLQRRLDGKPLIVRTLDIGGDKPHPGLDLPHEKNPFLGLRGIRLCLERPALFMPQIRALLRVAARGSLQVMLPMVSVQAEIDAARALFAEHLAALESEEIAAAMPSLGIMVETPAAALMADRLDAAFFSIGSNDLIQYTMAAARDGEGRVADLLDPGHPAIERLIRAVAEAGEASGHEVSLCGDMASEPDWLPLLLRAGIRKLSVAPASLDRVKLAISAIEVGRPTGGE